MLYLAEIFETVKVWKILFMMMFIIIIIIIIDLLKVEPHTPTPQKVEYDKKDGQWYTHDGVDIEETQARKGEW